MMPLIGYNSYIVDLRREAIALAPRWRDERAPPVVRARIVVYNKVVGESGLLAVDHRAGNKAEEAGGVGEERRR